MPRVSPRAAQTEVRRAFATAEVAVAEERPEPPERREPVAPTPARRRHPRPPNPPRSFSSCCSCYSSDKDPWAYRYPPRFD